MCSCWFQFIIESDSEDPEQSSSFWGAPNTPNTQLMRLPWNYWEIFISSVCFSQASSVKSVGRRPSGSRLLAAVTRTIQRGPASRQPKYGQWMWIMNNMFVTLPSGCSPGLGEYPHTINTCKLHSFSFPKIYTVHIKSRHLTIAEYKAAACILYYRTYI